MLKYEEGVDLTGKVAIVTGSNIGVGYAVASYLYQKGATVIMACRNQKKAEEAIESIKSATPSFSPAGGIEAWELDLSSLQSVRDFVRRWKEKRGQGDDKGRLDLLICNAGGIFIERKLTQDGFEQTYQVNHLSHYLLTLLMLPYLSLAPSPRIINTSSWGAMRGTMKLDNLNAEDLSTGWTTYNKFGRGVTLYDRSKLMQLIFAHRLQKLLLESPHPSHRRIIVQCAHPGIVNSNIANQPHYNSYKWVNALALWVMLKLFRTIEQGAMPIIWAAVSREAGQEGQGGWMYLDSCRADPNDFPAQFWDENFSKLFWEQSAKDAGCDPYIAAYSPI